MKTAKVLLAQFIDSVSGSAYNFLLQRPPSAGSIDNISSIFINKESDLCAGELPMFVCPFNQGLPSPPRILLLLFSSFITHDHILYKR